MSDIKMKRGDTPTFDVFATREDVNGVDQPIPLTGAKAWFYVKRERRDDDASALISLDTVADAAQIRFPAPVTQGVIRITLLSADTSTLAASYYPFDVQLKEADGTITTIESGFLELDRDVTITTA